MNKHNITILSREQVWGSEYEDKLDVIEKYGVRASATDLSVLTGGYFYNATIEDGVVVANLEEIPTPKTEIVLDTSSSINETLLKNFLRECKNILQHSRLKVGCFDTEFYGFHDIRTEKDIEDMKFEGSGGTDFNAAVRAFSRRGESKIIFTDGKSSMPDMPFNAIWIVFGDRQINPKGGKVICITPEQLRKLCSFEVENETKGRSR